METLAKEDILLLTNSDFCWLNRGNSGFRGQFCVDQTVLYIQSLLYFIIFTILSLEVIKMLKVTNKKSSFWKKNTLKDWFWATGMWYTSKESSYQQEHKLTRKSYGSVMRKIIDFSKFSLQKLGWQGVFHSWFFTFFYDES